MVSVRTMPAVRPSARIDRPGWIPAEITHNWDKNPYAYQTEEELMPAGGLHGQLLAYIIELLRDGLEQRKLMLLMDIFLLYRDQGGVKQRIAPDLLLMPFHFPPPSAYDLDKARPPRFVVEVTSPKSHAADLEDKAEFYLSLGVPAYLAIDAITPRNQLREQIDLHCWRLIDGQMQVIEMDEAAGFALPEMGVHISTRGQRLRFVDLVTRQPLPDMGELRVALLVAREVAAAQRRLAEAAQKVADAAQQLAAEERKARQRAEQELANAQAELKRLRGEQ